MIPLFELNDLKKAEFLARPNRFVAEIKINGKTDLAHVHDPGRLKELLLPGATLLVACGSKKAKLPWYAKAVEHQDEWILIDSALHSKISRKLFGIMEDFKKYKEIRSEVTLPTIKGKKKSRIDFTLDGIPLEVKGCSLVKNGIGLFPDAPTERGTRHVNEIIAHKGIILILIFRKAKKFSPNSEMDPKFSDSLSRARSAKIPIICAQIIFDGRKIFYSGKIPLAEF
jgi:sugar fermentation stimulation protein A